MVKPNFTMNSGMGDGAGANSTARERARDSDYEPRYGESRRKPGDQRAGAFDPASWVVEGLSGVWEEARRSDFGLSEEFWKHAYAARRESLLAARAALDAVLERTTSQATQEEERAQRRERRGGIDIEI